MTAYVTNHMTDYIIISKVLKSTKLNYFLFWKWSHDCLCNISHAHYVSAYVSLPKVLKIKQSHLFPFLEILHNQVHTPLYNSILHPSPFLENFPFWKYYVISHMISLCNPTKGALHCSKYTQIHPYYIILPPQFTLSFLFVVITGLYFY